jgi:hypothetical protein
VWSISAEPESVHYPPGGFDGWHHTWWLEHQRERCFVVVKVSDHAPMKAGEAMTRRSIAAVDSQGRSEVERWLTDALPPLAIEVRIDGEPVVTPGSPRTD